MKMRTGVLLYVLTCAAAAALAQLFPKTPATATPEPPAQAPAWGWHTGHVDGAVRDAEIARMDATHAARLIETRVDGEFDLPPRWGRQHWTILEALLAEEDPELQPYWLKKLFESVPPEDLPYALDDLLRLTRPSSARHEAAGILFDRWSSLDPLVAIAALQSSFPTGASQDGLLNQCLLNWSKADPLAPVQWALEQGLPLTPWIANNLIKQDPATAVQLLMTIEPYQMTSVHYGNWLPDLMLSLTTQYGAETALASTLALPDWMPINEALSRYGRQLSPDTSPTDLLAYAQAQGLTEAQQANLLNGLFDNSSLPLDSLVAVYGAAPESLADRVASQFTSRYLSEAPVGDAIAYAQMLAGQGEELFGAAYSLANRMPLVNDPQVDSTALMETTSAMGNDYATSRAFSAYNQADPAQGLQWLESADLPAGVKDYLWRNRSHWVQQGDTLASIAARHGITVEALQQANPWIDPERLWPGRELRIEKQSEEEVIELLQYLEY